MTNWFCSVFNVVCVVNVCPSPRCRSELIGSAWVVIVPGQKCMKKIARVINIRRVAENQMVSVRKRNIQGRYNSVRHLKRRYMELPPLRGTSVQLLKVQFRYRLKIPKQPEQDSAYTSKSKIFAPS